MEAPEARSAESVSNLEDEKQKALVAARNTLKKTERIKALLDERRS